MPRYSPHEPDLIMVVMLSGLFVFAMCVKGTFTDESSKCDPNPCFNGGKCVSQNPGHYSCVCANGFTGRRCDASVDDACTSSPCLFGGRCINSKSTNDRYICRCPSGFAGHNCKTFVGKCAGNPCLNNGTCNPAFSYPGYTCTCPQGFTGIGCEYNINECFSSPCVHGKCVDYVNSYKCNCDQNYTGDQCEIDMSVTTCHNIDCRFGTCAVNGTGSFCQCFPGFTGKTCDIDIDECRSHPCIHGDCQDHVNAFECVCHAGYVGHRCSLPAEDPCRHNPCVHGFCSINSEGFECICEENYTGAQCETLMTVCDHKCQNGFCINRQKDEDICTCFGGYTGDFCDQRLPGCFNNDVHSCNESLSIRRPYSSVTSTSESRKPYEQTTITDSGVSTSTTRSATIAIPKRPIPPTKSSPTFYTNIQPVSPSVQLSTGFMTSPTSLHYNGILYGLATMKRTPKASVTRRTTNEYQYTTTSRFSMLTANNTSNAHVTNKIHTASWPMLSTHPDASTSTKPFTEQTTSADPYPQQHTYQFVPPAVSTTFKPTVNTQNNTKHLENGAPFRVLHTSTKPTSNDTRLQALEQTSNSQLSFTAYSLNNGTFGTNVTKSTTKSGVVKPAVTSQYVKLHTVVPVYNSHTNPSSATQAHVTLPTTTKRTSYIDFNKSNINPLRPWAPQPLPSMPSLQSSIAQSTSLPSVASASTKLPPALKQPSSSSPTAPSTLPTAFSPLVMSLTNSEYYSTTFLKFTELSTTAAVKAETILEKISTSNSSQAGGTLMVTSTSGTPISKDQGGVDGVVAMESVIIGALFVVLVTVLTVGGYLFYRRSRSGSWSVNPVENHTRELGTREDTSVKKRYSSREIHADLRKGRLMSAKERYRALGTLRGSRRHQRRYPPPRPTPHIYTSSSSCSDSSDAPKANVIVIPKPRPGQIVTTQDDTTKRRQTQSVTRDDKTKPGSGQIVTRDYKTKPRPGPIVTRVDKTKPRSEQLVHRDNHALPCQLVTKGNDNFADVRSCNQRQHWETFVSGDKDAEAVSLASTDSNTTYDNPFFRNMHGGISLNLSEFPTRRDEEEFQCLLDDFLMKEDYSYHRPGTRSSVFYISGTNDGKSEA